MLHVQLGAGFNAWKDALSASKLAEMRLEIEMLKNARGVEIFRRMAAQWQSASSRQAFAAWRRETAWRRTLPLSLIMHDESLP